MGAFPRSFLASVCLVALLTLTACSEAPGSKATSKRIGWKETAQKIKELEAVKRETVEALRRKAQPRTPQPQRADEDASQQKRRL